ncbi:MAG: hypothetical protein AAF899_02030 [Pseudomonadota bacterium]
MMRFLFGVCLGALIAGPATAQTTIDAFHEKDAEAAASEGVADADLAKFEDVLNGGDVDRAIRAMRFMIESEKPRLVRAAKTFGLRSVNPLFQEEAMKAIFQQGGPFRLELDLTTADEEVSRMQYFTDWLGGTVSVDKASGYYTFALGGYDEKKKCWLNIANNKCLLTQALTTVDLAGVPYASGNLELNGNGVLEGAFKYKSGGVSVPARIELIN